MIALRLTPLVALLAVAPALAAGGFSADDLASAARQSTVQQQRDLAALRVVAARSERLRATLAVAQDRLAAGEWSTDEQAALASAFGPPTQDRDVLLGWLMRGGHVLAAAPDLTGIYNPLADGWLVLRWSSVAGTPRLVQAVLVNGATLRAGAEPVGGGSAASFAQTLVARRVAAEASATELASLGSDRFFALYGPLRIGQTKAVLAQARAQVGALAQWSRGHAAQVASLTRQIERAASPAVLSVPVRLRAQLSPIAVAATPQGTQVVLQSPVFPARSLVATFASDGSAPDLFGLDLTPQPLDGSAAR